MAKTVVGLMESFDAARGVVEELRASGLGGAEVELMSSESEAAATQTSAANDDGSVAEILSQLGVPEDEAHWYEEGVSRGGTLITARVGTEQQAQRAARIIRRNGALDIDGRVLTAAEAALAQPEAPGGAARIYSRDAEPTVEAIVTLEEEEIPAAAPYAGPERRLRNQPYSGIERRKAA